MAPILKIVNLMQNMFHIERRHINRIKKVPEENGIKQTRFAEEFGKSFNIVNTYACNRRQPNLELLFAIAKIL